MNAYVSYALKAIGTAVASFCGYLIGVLPSGSIEWWQWVLGACWAVVSGLAVFGIRNGPNPAASATRSIEGTSVTYEPDAGHTPEH